MDHHHIQIIELPQPTTVITDLSNLGIAHHHEPLFNDLQFQPIHQIIDVPHHLVYSGASGSL